MYNPKISHKEKSSVHLSQFVHTPSHSKFLVGQSSRSRLAPSCWEGGSQSVYTLGMNSYLTSNPIGCHDSEVTRRQVQAGYIHQQQ